MFGLLLKKMSDETVKPIWIVLVIIKAEKYILRYIVMLHEIINIWMNASENRVTENRWRYFSI